MCFKRTAVAKAVIGANFGDEGKGLITDYLAAPYGEDAVVIRFNGGAQAGHTVETKEGIRHVFSHFGSGTLAGATTCLSQFFICDPISFEEEYRKLGLLNIKPIVFVDPRAIVSTPYDMVINCVAEENRQGKKHGSCGLGIGETVERNMHPEFSLTVGDLTNKAHLRTILYKIKSSWSKQRLQELGVTSISDYWQSWFYLDGIMQKYLNMVEFFLDHVTIMPIENIPSYPAIIFEGAQGLWLDQDHGWFPHVTRSNTGCKNILSLLKPLGCDTLAVHYISRVYLTRHGRGPLPHELSQKPYEGVYDKTNIENTYQESLRYAFLNLPLLIQGIHRDHQLIASDIKCNYGLALTCFDQVGDHLHYFVDDTKVVTTSRAKLIEKLVDNFSCPVWLQSEGPTRHDITAVL